MNNRVNLFLLSVMLLGGIDGAEAANVRLHGRLVAEPCIVVSEYIEVDFGTIVDKYLYKNIRTLGQPFEIELGDCDLSLGNVVKVTFIGVESPTLGGLLAVGTPSKGIAIGIETPAGKSVKFNQPSDAFALQSATEQLEFKAYVQGESLAITEKSIERGDFSVTSIFKLDYP